MAAAAAPAINLAAPAVWSCHHLIKMVILDEVYNYERRVGEFTLFEYGIADREDDMHQVSYLNSREEQLQLNSIYGDHIIRVRYHQRPESGAAVEERTLYLRFNSHNLQLEVSDNIEFVNLRMTGTLTAQFNNAEFDIQYTGSHIYIVPSDADEFVSDRVNRQGARSFIGYRIVPYTDMRGRTHVYIEPVECRRLAVAA